MKIDQILEIDLELESVERRLQMNRLIVISEQFPGNGKELREKKDQLTARREQLIKELRMDEKLSLLQVMHDLYANEINFKIESRWDDGFHVSVGNGYNDQWDSCNFFKKEEITKVRDYLQTKLPTVGQQQVSN